MEVVPTTTTITITMGAEAKIPGTEAIPTA
jgi:hypothetical protein